MKWTAANGTSYSDEQVEQWAKAQESEAEYSGKHLTPAMPGRPVSVGKTLLPLPSALTKHVEPRLLL